MGKFWLGKLAKKRQPALTESQEKLSMETVTDALKAMGKATAREVAARLLIETKDVLEMLREQEDSGRVIFLNGYWSLSGPEKELTDVAREKIVNPVTPVETVMKIDEKQLTDAIRKHGPQTADERSRRFSTTARKVASTLAMATGKGRLLRINHDGKFRYSLPDDGLPEKQKACSAMGRDDNPAPQPEAIKLAASVTAAEASTDNVADLIQSIPSFTERRHDDVVIPTPRAISAEIRRTEAKLKRLKKCREISRQVHKPGNRALWQGLSTE
ncbi:DUF1627 domain-containing protein [Escherichia coli]|nr:DUF1627 domain-containing protein [Escherichia coli]EFO3849199.1 hypothetical protein [Escherichia coli]EGF7420012.1 DUF1627 domain-containing protein [Escherichia coli]